MYSPKIPTLISCTPPKNNMAIIKVAQPETQSLVNNRITNEYTMPKSASKEQINPNRMDIFRGLVENDKMLCVLKRINSNSENLVCPANRFDR